MPTWPSPRSEQLGTPNPPRNPFHAGQVFRGFPIHAFATACQVARSPVRIRPTRSALESFYFQASNGSVALPVAGYDYNSDWTPLLAGLSPARMAASLAAPDPDVTRRGTPAGSQTYWPGLFVLRRPADSMTTTQLRLAISEISSCPPAPGLLLRSMGSVNVQGRLAPSPFCGIVPKQEQF